MRKISMILGICLVLLVFAVGCGTCDESAVKIDAEVGVSAAVALTEARVDGLVSCMDTMSMAEEVQSVDWETMVGLLEKFEDTSIPLVVWFALPDGSYHTVDTGLSDANIADRDYFPKVMAGETVIGDLLVSKSTGREAMVIVVPVKDGGDVVGVLGVSVYLDDLSQLTANDMELSSDIVLYAVNGEDVIALHTDTSLILEDASEDGDLSQSVSATSSLLGWTFTLGFE
ncbi:MAG: hypothetical protein U9N44_03925 [Chloroflexota bacterium]|nr:hypothetical protein [Chloroflexota bacterium]